MHGGAAGSGAPHGPRNGAFRDGTHTNEAKLLRKLIGEVLKSKPKAPANSSPLADRDVVKNPDTDAAKKA